MEGTKIWSRVGRWLKRTDASPTRGGDDGGMASPPGATRGELVSTPPPGTASEEPAALSRFRLSRSGPPLERLEEEYKRVVKLIDTIQSHMSSQGERSEAMTRSLDRMAEHFAEMSGAARKQSEYLSEIAETSATEAACAKRVEDGLLQLPQLADAQRETMVSIGGQLDLSRQTIDRVAGSMDGFQQAVGNLAQVTEASTKKLQEMRWDTTAREERIAALLQEQNRRMTYFAVAAMALALVAAVMGVIALFR